MEGQQEIEMMLHNEKRKRKEGKENIHRILHQEIVENHIK